MKNNNKSILIKLIISLFIFSIAYINKASTHANKDTIVEKYVNLDTIYIYYDYYDNPTQMDNNKERIWRLSYRPEAGWYFVHQKYWRISNYFYFAKDYGKLLSIEGFEKLKLSNIDNLMKPLKDIMWKDNPLCMNLISYYPNVIIVHRQRDKRIYLYKITKWDSYLAPIF